jgi:predicted RNase H-like HicB family nuclease
MKLSVLIYEGEDGYFVIECPAIPGCISQGRTREEAFRNIRDAIEACIAVRREMGLPIAVETAELEVAVL